MSEINLRGEFVHTCEKCGTSHQGHPPNTVAGDLACLRARLGKIAHPLARHMENGLDDLEEMLRHGRDELIRRHFQS